MTQKGVNRRNFLNTAVVGASALTLSTSNRVLGANDRMRIAWVGCGGRGSYLARRALTVDSIEIAAACDLKPERAARVQQYVQAEEDREIKTYQDFRQMIEKEKPDAILCATEVGNHAKVVVPVLEMDLHCLSEKCMEANVEKVDAITRAARKSNAVYQVAFQRRSDVGMRAGIKAIHDGKIGKVLYMQAQWHWGGTGRVGGWVGDVEMSGGKLVEQACHHMDLMNWVKGNVAPTHAVAIGAITYDYEEMTIKRKT